MKTLMIDSPKITAENTELHIKIQKTLLICGIVSSLLYVFATIIGAAQWPGYSTLDQSISELIEIGRAHV
mgnify:FL=1